MDQRRDTDAPDAVASPEDLAAELVGMMRTGVTSASCQKTTAILELAIVRAKAPTDTRPDRAVSATNLIREACAGVDDVAVGNTAVLLGLAAGFRGTQAKVRRQHVADSLVVTVDHVRNYREPQLLEAVADELYAMDSAYRLRHRHRNDIERDPSRTAIQIDWAAQHRSYRRVWSPVTGLRADVLILASYLRDAQKRDLVPSTVAAVEERGPGQKRLLAGDEWHAVAERCMTLCWRLARFERELAFFVEREGGLWLLADAESELQAADCMYRLGIHLPFGEADLSALRLLIANADGQELDPFEDAMLANERWPIFRDVWIEWVTGYVERDAVKPVAREELLLRPADAGPSGIVRVTTGLEQSEAGRWLVAGERFIQLIDADWYRVADWYRTLAQPGS